MVELSKAQLTGIISLIMILTGAVTIQNVSKTYYCETEHSVKECVRLSSTLKTCYWLGVGEKESADLCSNGLWKPITDYIKLPTQPDALQDVTIQKPVIITNAKLFEDMEGRQYVEGYCISRLG